MKRYQLGIVAVVIMVVVLLFAFWVWMLLFKSDDQNVVNLPQQSPIPTSTTETISLDEKILYPCTSTTNAKLTPSPEYNETDYS